MAALCVLAEGRSLVEGNGCLGCSHPFVGDRLQLGVLLGSAGRLLLLHTCERQIMWGTRCGVGWWGVMRGCS